MMVTKCSKPRILSIASIYYVSQSYGEPRLRIDRRAAERDRQRAVRAYAEIFLKATVQDA